MSKKLNNQFICSRMMLPEHVRALSKYEQESKLKELCKRPELDEQRLEEFDRVLQRAIKEELLVRVMVLTERGPVMYDGKVQKIATGKLYIEIEEEVKLVELSNVVNIDEAI